MRRRMIARFVSASLVLMPPPIVWASAQAPAMSPPVVPAASDRCAALASALPEGRILRATHQRAREDYAGRAQARVKDAVKALLLAYSDRHRCLSRDDPLLVEQVRALFAADIRRQRVRSASAISLLRPSCSEQILKSVRLKPVFPPRALHEPQALPTSSCPPRTSLREFPELG